MPAVQTVLSPALAELADFEERAVVVIDVFRATTTIVSALNSGWKEVRPVVALEEALALQDSGYYAAAERGGQKVDGFDGGNSPLEYQSGPGETNRIALTTTNGTKCVAMALELGAVEVFAGSLRNRGAMVERLKQSGLDVVLFCAGWKQRVNFEDTLLAGALADGLIADGYEIKDDSTLDAQLIWKAAEADPLAWAQKASHWTRLAGFGLEDDVRFSLQVDQTSVVPVLRDGAFVLD